MPRDLAKNGTDCHDCPALQELAQQVADLHKLVGGQQERIGELEQQVARSAAPFRVPEDKRVTAKRKPGRKPGHAPAHREPPPQVDEYVEVPLPQCPRCGGPVHDVRPVRQVIEDIPIIQPYRLGLTTYQGQCPHCGPVRSTHPAQVSTAQGAAGTHLGARALAFSALLNKRHGLTLRRTCAVLEQGFGLSLSPGGLSQALTRMAAKVAPAYEQLREHLRHSPAVHSDETGWWVDGHTAWLWVFTNDQYTLYHIGPRNGQVLTEQLGDDFAGVLISDCLNIYDAHPGRKSKCVAHHLKAIKQALREKPNSGFLLEIRALLKGTALLHHAREQMDPGYYAELMAGAAASLDRLLAPEYPPGTEEKIANRLRKQRPHLLTFLHEAGVDPTNNQAERQLRPAVIARKLSCGNRSEAGARAQAILASLAATCAQQGQDFSAKLAGHLCLANAPPADWFPSQP